MSNPQKKCELVEFVELCLPSSGEAAGMNMEEDRLYQRWYAVMGKATATKMISGLVWCVPQFNINKQNIPTRV